MNSIIWKGVPSTTINGLLISELPPISAPAMRVQEITIDGRDGSLLEDLGYSSYDKNIVIGLHGNFDINKVIKYFTGEGEVVFSNEPDKVYTAKIIGQIDYNRLLRYRQATIPFRVQPFKHKLNEAYKESKTSTATGTSIILNDCANAPMRIETEATNVLVHGKNLVNPYAFTLENNKSFEVQADGFKIVAVGGTAGAYTASRYTLPLSMKGKSYCLKCDELTYTETLATFVQVVVSTPTQTHYFAINPLNKTTEFKIPDDATKIMVGVWTNNTAEKLGADNIVTVSGLMILPIERKADAWTPYVAIQEATVEGGVALLNGNSPFTVISNAENAEMEVTYFKNYEVFNEGLESSRPLMVLKGRGTVEISVNGTSIFSYTFPEGENEVVIDSEKEDAYLGSVLKNRNMNGEFPILLPKTNIIGWSGDVERIEILPRSRWL